ISAWRSVGQWKAGYNPDVMFTSHSISGLSKKLVIEPLPKTQHRPLALPSMLQLPQPQSKNCVIEPV
uniref:Uncharacterized protein n=1 Tax=Astyanax mexicanus TaxID=7994 RepID=A0A3B1IZI4_ASTMX